MRRFFIVALLSLSTLTFGQEQKASTPDDRISDQVRMKLATDPDVKGGALDVTVHGGTVTIKGRVDTEKGKSKTEFLQMGFTPSGEKKIYWSNRVILNVE